MPKNCQESNLFSEIRPEKSIVRKYHDFLRSIDSNLQLSEDFAARVCLMRYRNSFVTFVVLLLVVQQYE